MAGSFFDFPYTCFKYIDPSIEHIEDDIRSLTIDSFPEIDRDRVEQFVNDLYHLAFENYIEDVRSSNSDMRSAAEKQLEKSYNEIEDLQDYILELKNEIEELQNKNSELKNEIEELKYV